MGFEWFEPNKVELEHKVSVAFCTDHLLYRNGGIRYIYEVTRRLAKDYNVSLIVQAISESNE